MFLKHLNSILKNFAGAIELFFTTAFSYILFNVAIDTSTTVSVLLIWISLYIYAKNPLKTAEISKDDEEKAELIDSKA